MRLKDKLAVITGGSRGIGFATADKFVNEGAIVILTASSQASADKAVNRLKEKYPKATVKGISPNLTNLESVQKAFSEIVAQYGGIDILVNNAGVSEDTPTCPPPSQYSGVLTGLPGSEQTSPGKN